MHQRDAGERPLAASPRVDALLRLLQSRPEDERTLFGLALEYEKIQAWENAVEMLQRYLRRADDEGNAYGRLGHALRMLGREDDARDAYASGIEAALRHGHPTMATEFEEILEHWR